MIAFNKYYSEQPQDPLKKLQQLLNKIDLFEEDDFLEEAFDENTSNNSNLSELLEIVYFHLFTENYSNIDLSITKNKNNSLEIKIKKLS
jgi:enolase